MNAAEILPCYHQTVSGVCVKSCSARGRHWQHSELRAPGTSPWLMLLGQTHIPLLCHSLRAATGTRDQYWLQCHFPCRLKSFTLRICQRNAFLLYRYQEGFGDTWWQRTTCTFLYYSLALSLVLVLKTHCNGLFLVLSQESKWEVFSCLFSSIGKAMLCGSCTICW